MHGAGVPPAAAYMHTATLTASAALWTRTRWTDVHLRGVRRGRGVRRLFLWPARLSPVFAPLPYAGRCVSPPRVHILINPGLDTSDVITEWPFVAAAPHASGFTPAWPQD